MHRISTIKIYETFDRPAVKNHRRLFVPCSRAKACNFSGFVNILRNDGDRCGNLDRVRNTYPEAGNSNASGTGSVRVSAREPTDFD